jgi:hypothetical protein
VLGQLREDLLVQNLITLAFEVRLGLIVGNGHKKDIDALPIHFTARAWAWAWAFWGPEDVKCKVQNFASKKYCDDPAFITAKILQR